MKKIVLVVSVFLFAAQFAWAQVESKLFVQEPLQREAFDVEADLATYSMGKEQLKLLDDGALLVAGMATSDFSFAGVDVTSVTEGTSYLKKYSATGEPQWIVWMSEGMSNTRLLEVDKDGNIFLAGCYGGQITIKDTEGNTEILPKPDGVDMTTPDYTYLIKLDDTGVVKWSKYFQPEMATGEWMMPKSEPTALALSEGKIAFAFSFQGLLNIDEQEYSSLSWMYGYARAWSSMLLFMDESGELVNLKPFIAVEDPDATNEDDKTVLSDMVFQQMVFGPDDQLFAVASLSGCVKDVDTETLYKTEADEYFMVPQLQLFAFDQTYTQKWSKYYPMDKGHTAMDGRHILQTKSIGVVEDQITVGGMVQDTIFIDQQEEVYINSVDEMDGFVASFNVQDGSFIRTRQIKTQGQSDDNMAFVFSHNHTYVSGVLTNTVVIGGKSVKTNNEADLFLADFNHYNETLMLEATGGGGHEFVQAIDVTEAGEIATTGTILSLNGNDCEVWGEVVSSTQQGENFIPDIYVNKIISTVNARPTASRLLDDQIVSVEESFEYALPKNIFSDPDGDKLVITSCLDNGTALPEWLIFDNDQITYSGIPAKEDLGLYQIRITATDRLGASVSLHFQIYVQSTTGLDEVPASQLLFYPNPSDGSIFFNTQISRVEVFNITGQRVMIMEDCQSIDFKANGLKRGTYFIRMSDDYDNTRTEKLLLK
ncbi:MAG: T9SS type A sorting domain-containing protein [Bacteroidales bacterium]